MTRLLRAFAILLPLVLAACPPPAAPQREGPARPPRPEVAPLAEPWIVGAPSGETRHRIDVIAELRSRVDTLERVDSSFSSVEAASSRIVSGGTFRLSGLLTGFRAGSTDSTATVPDGMVLPQPFSAELAAPGSQPRLTQPREEECSLPAIAAQSLRELWVATPPRLTTGLFWSDSARFTLCRDSIPLAVVATRRYRVVGAELRDTAVVVLLERDSRTTFRGEGMQFGERIIIEGEGRALTRLSISLAGGVVIDGEGEGEVTLRMQGRRRSQELRQLTRTTIRRP